MTPANRHGTELRRQLLEAAYRRPHNTPSGPVRWHRARLAAGLVAAATLTFALLGTLVISDTRSAAADTFSFDVDGEELVISVIGTVENPVAAAAELEGRDFDVRMTAVPAAPRYEGKIISVSSDDPDIRVDINDGAVNAIRVPIHEPVSLSINYGREASAGEPYQATGSVSDCSAYAGQAVTPALEREITGRYGPTVRWQQIGDAGITDQPAEELAPVATIIDIIPLSDTAVMVIVTDGKAAPPPGMVC